MIELVLGGARSGKSRYAERQTEASDQKVIYIATCIPGDDEMRQRIARHRQDRPGHWRTIEEPVQLGQSIRQYQQPGCCLLIDCLTLWLSNILFGQNGEITQSLFQQEKTALLSALESSTGDIILVSNEVGQGIVPIDPGSRRFVDEAGWLHQDIARISGKVTLISAGLPVNLKG